MGLLERIFDKLRSRRDPSTLYVSIDELPNPRDWGTLDFAVGNKLIFSEDVNLVAPTVDAVEALIGQHWQEIQSSGYQRIVYENVSKWVQEKIEEKLGKLCTSQPKLSSCVKQ